MAYTMRWELVENNVNERLVDDSLLHTLTVDKKINRRTKIFNKKLKKLRVLRSYKHFLSLKQQIHNECSDSETETDDEPDMDHESYKKFYNDKSCFNSEQLRTFLKLCVRMKGRPRYKEKPEKTKANKKPTVVCKKSARVRILKNSERYQSKKDAKVEPQTNFKRYSLRLSNKQLKLGSEEQHSEPVAAKLLPPKTDPTDLKEIPSTSKDEDKDQGNNKKEKGEEEKLINDSSANNIENGSVDISESISAPNSPLHNDCTDEYRSKETTSAEPQSTASTKIDNVVEFETEMNSSNNPEQGRCNAVVNPPENLSNFNSTSNSSDMFDEDNLCPKDNLTMSELKIDSVEDFCFPTETNDSALTSDHDSGNNSLSDANSLAEQFSRRYSTSVSYDTCDRKTVIKHNLNAIEKKVIPPDELEKTETKRDEIVELSNLDDDASIAQIKLECENFLEKERQAGSYDSAVGEKSRELMATRELDVQLESESFAENKANEAKSKLKIRKIEHFQQRFEFLNDHWYCKQQNIELSNNSVCEVKHPVESLPPPKPNEHALKSTESSANCSFSSIGLSNLDGSLDDDISSLLARANAENIEESNAEELILEGEKRSEDNIFSREDNLRATQSPTPSHSSIKSYSSFCTRSYDEEFENCFKTQLLSETERLIEYSEPCKEKNLYEVSNDCSQDEQQLLLIESNEAQSKSIGIRPIAESTQLSVSSGSTEKLKHTEILPHNLNKFSIITDSLPSPEPSPNKRSISSINADCHVFTSTPSSQKQPRLSRQTANKQLQVRSCEYASPEARSCELQPAENKDDSPNRSNQKQSTPDNVEPKRRLRPRTLEEFATAEALCPDMTEPYFRWKNISEDDEIWLMDVPKTINLQDLKDQIITLGGKSAITLEDDCYKVSSKPSKKACNISCVFNTSKRKKEYKIVNVEVKGRIKLTREDSEIPESELTSRELKTVPFPENLKRRHPLLGTTIENKI